MNLRELFSKTKLAKFFSQNNIFCIVILVAAFGPIYMQRADDARRLEQIETQVETQADAPDSGDPAIAVIADQIKVNRQPIASQSVVEAKAAKAGITDRQYELISGYCTRFAREVVETYNGKAYAEYFAGNAKATANNFLDSPYGHLYHAGDVIQPGDLLFKRFGSGGYGHVGVYVGDVPGIGKQLVAENSSTSIGRIQGAKGYRTLAQFGTFDVLVRLPLPAGYATPTTPRLIVAAAVHNTLQYHAIETARLENGHWTANSAVLMKAIKRTAPTSDRVTVIDYLKAQHAYPYLISQHLGDKKDPRTYLFVDASP